MKWQVTAIVAATFSLACDSAGPAEPSQTLAVRSSVVPSGTVVQLAGITAIVDVGQVFITKNDFQEISLTGCEGVSFAGHGTGVYTGPVGGGDRYYASHILPPGTRLRFVTYLFPCSGITGFRWVAEVI